jgi:hypothetical protein
MLPSTDCSRGQGDDPPGGPVAGRGARGPGDGRVDLGKAVGPEAAGGAVPASVRAQGQNPVRLHRRQRAGGHAQDGPGEARVDSSGLKIKSLIIQIRI